VPGIAYLDTNVFIDALEGADSISLPIKALFEAARSKPGALVTSELTLAEVLAPGRRGARPPDLRRRYLDLIVWGGVVDLRPVSLDVIYETIELRPYAPLKLPDAIHLATAIMTGCRYLVTRDQGFHNVPTGMQVVSPEPPQLARIMEGLLS
jgi:predicted nucleic acid-binding protein